MLAQRSLEFDHVVLIYHAVKFKSFKPAPTPDAVVKCPHSLAVFRWRQLPPAPEATVATLVPRLCLGTH